jgi:hypothetical protein
MRHEITNHSEVVKVDTDNNMELLEQLTMEKFGAPNNSQIIRTNSMHC